jgi:hypothetical protein
MKVNTNGVVFIFSTLIFLVALWFRWTLFADVSSHGRYYFASIIGISGFTSVITLLRFIKERHPAAEQSTPASHEKAAQKRRNYRVSFDRSNRPVFVQKADASGIDPAFTCKVIDISETGLGLDCTGVYEKGQTILGDVILENGKTAPINGEVLRENSNGTFIRLHCTIPPSLVMEAQRSQIQSEKEMGPLPAAVGSPVGTPNSSLPSHRPKGLCRLKNTER